jgi:hypothetical protein
MIVIPRRKRKRSRIWGIIRDKKVRRRRKERRRLWRWRPHVIDIDIPPIRVTSHHLLHW